MSRIIFRILNIPGLIVLLAIAVAIQTSLFNFWPVHYFQPDSILIFVIWCALKRKFIEGGAMSLVFANIGELHSSAPQGIMLLNYVLIFLTIRFLARWIVLPSLSAVTVLAAFASIAWKVLIALSLKLLAGMTISWHQPIAYVIPGALSEAGLAFFGFKLLEKWDWITFKTRRADHDDYEKLEYGEWQTWNELVQDEFRSAQSN